MNVILWPIFLLLAARLSSSEREHKVHNIVLHPEKYSWCMTTPIQQIVGSPGYKPVTIDNSICVGVCYSYSIPKTQPAEPGELIGPYCESCQPSKIKCYHVNLEANDNNLDGPRTMQKRVQIIMDCSCANCEKIRREDCDISDENTLELPENLFYKSSGTNKTDEDRPELLKMQKAVLEHRHHFIKHHHHHKKILDFFSGNRFENGSSPNEQLNEIFDYQKVKDLLDKTGNDDDNDEDFIIPISHYNVEEGGTTEEVPKVGGTPHHVGGPPHLDHHLGEIQQVSGTVEHLVKGPHGSMVLEPVHLDSDDLKANDEGVVITYENHDNKKTPHHLIVN